MVGYALRVERLPRKQTEGSHLDKGEFLDLADGEPEVMREKSSPAFWALLPARVRPLPDKAPMTIFRAEGPNCFADWVFRA